MPRDRAELERIERDTLASYAQFSDASRGRVYPEEPSDWRTHYQRDRDRVIHSRAFRRLEYKTQVFLNGSGDHIRTRLTHTMEVAAISRNIARALRLNEDLAETIALAHDLGHSPFGHRGEAVLNRLMLEHGGFEHNRQSLRIVDSMESKYPTHPGLNLSWETREGLMKHRTVWDDPELEAEFDAPYPTLEAQVANVSDEIAYYSHDLDDGLETDLLDEQALGSNVAIWASGARQVQQSWGELNKERRRYFIIRCIIDEQVKDVVRESERRILDSGISSADQARLREGAPLVSYSQDRGDQNQELRAYLFDNLYWNPVVRRPNERAGAMLERLFLDFINDINKAPPQVAVWAKEKGVPRAVCDYLSALTDGGAIRQYIALYGRDENVPEMIPPSSPFLY